MAEFRHALEELRGVDNLNIENGEFLSSRVQFGPNQSLPGFASPIAEVELFNHNRLSDSGMPMERFEAIHKGLGAKTANKDQVENRLAENGLVNGSLGTIRDIFYAKAYPQLTSTPNLNGTNLHVNSGCISINGIPRCEPQIYNVADQGRNNSIAMIYAEFNANNTEYQNIIPGCQLFAAWPHSYGDIYFGEDNCLYDSSGNSIDGQCCTAATTASVANPYFQYPAWDTTGPAGFHIVEYIEYMYGNPPEDHVWLGVVGSANINCTTIVNNQNKYTAYGSLGNGFLRPGQLAGDYPMPPDYVNSSTTQFYLFGAKDPLCGVTSPSNFTLGFNSTWTTNGPGSFGFRDSPGTTGTCIIHNQPKKSACQDSEGYRYQMVDLMACEADENPSYCAGY
ncbi:hypothetical protein V8E54_013782 [Elaphomyces granulatus]